MVECFTKSLAEFACYASVTYPRSISQVSAALLIRGPGRRHQTLQSLQNPCLKRITAGCAHSKAANRTRLDSIGSVHLIAQTLRVRVSDLFLDIEDRIDPTPKGRRRRRA